MGQTKELEVVKHKPRKESATQGGQNGNEEKALGAGEG